jgi:hypothetical protein
MQTKLQGLPSTISLSTSDANKLQSMGAWAGWLTGGKGFVSEELQSAGEGKLYMITEKGDFVTLTGKETVAKSVFDLIALYTADYITNSAEAGQAWADKVMPVADTLVDATMECKLQHKPHRRDCRHKKQLAHRARQQPRLCGPGAS